ncbi:hypothetical protein FPQ18DRAFT_327606 [Pyronema domesticum]|uniref:Uncharacterized protein n=1 Tax=Pyronema omphalodes (strain CBS 100304) TaxID=1076935 RepID=U4LA02_PYROM|nr:hypothetical protein FPQ18DRAFT_327606 [Pyronema domesticum]CCX07014.1 Similar to hypothetical protein NFIA_023260 [Neosartorya fischeri NRRL 181]; acc. no. XP_001265512 [Pyronema omphalodes CBS 100304]
MATSAPSRPRPQGNTVESDEDSDYDSEFDEVVPQQNQQLQQRQQRQQQQNQQQQPGQVQQQQPQKEKKGGAPSVRIDLNIELEVTLKARIHGDLTLALLT